jgi:LCP family protein required for cell wall assembly
MGTYGELNTQNAIAEAFDIDINYSVKVTDESLVKVVDTLGGIEYCSDVAYTTTHAVVIDTYDDTKGSKLYVKAGCQKLNGLETLTVARERNAFPGRDRQRQKNVQNIMESILKKVATFNTLSNYNKVLDSISGLYTTNIPREKITNLAEVTIDGAKWTVEKQSVDGQDTQGFVYQSNKVQDWIMIPDESTIEEAKKNIQAIMS